VRQDSLVPLHEELPRLLPEPCHHYRLYIFIWLESTAFGAFFSRQNMAQFHLNNSHKSINRDAGVFRWRLQMSVENHLSSCFSSLSEHSRLLPSCQTVRLSAAGDLFVSLRVCNTRKFSHSYNIIIANTGYKLHMELIIQFCTCWRNVFLLPAKLPLNIMPKRQSTDSSLLIRLFPLSVCVVWTGFIWLRIRTNWYSGSTRCWEILE
jgi:hypothetical protein